MPTRLELLRSLKERINQQLEQSGVRYWKPKVGSNSIRILPNWTGDPSGLFFKAIYAHWNVGESEGKKKKVICPSTDGRTDCPICQLVEELYKSGVAEDEKEARSMARRERFVVNVLDLNSQNMYDVLVYEMGPQLFKDILFMFTDGEFGDLDSPTEGRTIKIERSGTQLMDTRYIVMPSARPSSIDMKLVKELTNLDHVFKPLSAEAIEKILLGGAPDQASQEEEETFIPLGTKTAEPEAPAPAPKPETPKVEESSPAPKVTAPPPPPPAAAGVGAKSQTQFNLRERLNKLRTEKSG